MWVVWVGSSCSSTGYRSSQTIQPLLLNKWSPAESGLVWSCFIVAGLESLCQFNTWRRLSALITWCVITVRRGSGVIVFLRSGLQCWTHNDPLVLAQFLTCTWSHVSAELGTSLDSCPDLHRWSPETHTGIVSLLRCLNKPVKHKAVHHGRRFNLVSLDFSYHCLTETCWVRTCLLLPSHSRNNSIKAPFHLSQLWVIISHYPERATVWSEQGKHLILWMFHYSCSLQIFIWNSWNQMHEKPFLQRTDHTTQTTPDGHTR